MIYARENVKKINFIVGICAFFDESQSFSICQRSYLPTDSGQQGTISINNDMMNGQILIIVYF